MASYPVTFTLLLLPVAIVVSLLSSLPAVKGDVIITASFHDASNPGSFQHLRVDSATGRVYVGATNRLYQLTESLAVEVSVTTGPRDDNPLCPPPSGECHCAGGANCQEFKKYPIDAVNKVLLIDHRNNRLIACTNLFQVSLTTFRYIVSIFFRLISSHS